MNLTRTLTLSVACTLPVLLASASAFALTVHSSSGITNATPSAAVEFPESDTNWTQLGDWDEQTTCPTGWTGDSNGCLLSGTYITGWVLIEVPASSDHLNFVVESATARDDCSGVYCDDDVTYRVYTASSCTSSSWTYRGQVTLGDYYHQADLFTRRTNSTDCILIARGGAGNAKPDIRIYAVDVTPSYF